MMLRWITSRENATTSLMIMLGRMTTMVMQFSRHRRTVSSTTVSVRGWRWCLHEGRMLNRLQRSRCCKTSCVTRENIGLLFHDRWTFRVKSLTEQSEVTRAYVIKVNKYYIPVFPVFARWWCGGGARGYPWFELSGLSPQEDMGDCLLVSSLWIARDWRCDIIRCLRGSLISIASAVSKYLATSLAHSRNPIKW